MKYASLLVKSNSTKTWLEITYSKICPSLLNNLFSWPHTLCNSRRRRVSTEDSLGAHSDCEKIARIRENMSYSVGPAFQLACWRCIEFGLFGRCRSQSLVYRHRRTAMNINVDEMVIIEGRCTSSVREILALLVYTASAFGNLLAHTMHSTFNKYALNKQYSARLKRFALYYMIRKRSCGAWVAWLSSI